MESSSQCGLAVARHKDCDRCLEEEVLAQLQALVWLGGFCFFNVFIFALALAFIFVFWRQDLT